MTLNSGVVDDGRRKVFVDALGSQHVGLWELQQDEWEDVLTVEDGCCKGGRGSRHDGR